MYCIVYHANAKKIIALIAAIITLIIASTMSEDVSDNFTNLSQMVMAEISILSGQKLY